MKPNESFLHQSAEFWAIVRYASEQLKYSKRAKRGSKVKKLRRYTLDEMAKFSVTLGIDDEIIGKAHKYMNYRAEILESTVRDQLMKRSQAARVFKELRATHNPKCYLPRNKQKGKKKHYSYFTCIVNILTEQCLGADSFVDNPGQLPIVRDPAGKLVKTLSRRIDGAFPTLDSPMALWEIKEYYGTTTFGSRVADAVYETQLDGYELREAESITGHGIYHYLLVDDRFTWWDCGRSYLCRLVDITHMGLVDEVIYGREVTDRWPEIVRSWVE